MFLKLPPISFVVGVFIIQPTKYSGCYWKYGYHGQIMGHPEWRGSGHSYSRSILLISLSSVLIISCILL